MLSFRLIRLLLLIRDVNSVNFIFRDVYFIFLYLSQMLTISQHPVTFHSNFVLDKKNYTQQLKRERHSGIRILHYNVQIRRRNQLISKHTNLMRKCTNQAAVSKIRAKNEATNRIKKKQIKDTTQMCKPYVNYD